MKVQKYVRSCDECQKRKPSNSKNDNLLLSLPTPNEPWHTVCVDFAGPLVTTERGNKNILVVIDVATRYVEAEATSSQSAETTADVLLSRIIFKHGAPKVFITDKGRNFMSRVIRLLLNRLGVDQRSTTAYNPQCNGLVERQNRTIAEALSMYVQNRNHDWDLWHPCAAFAINTAKHDVMKVSPYELLYFRQPSTFIDTFLPGQPNDFLTMQISLIKKIRQDVLDRFQQSVKRRSSDQAVDPKYQKETRCWSSKTCHPWERTRSSKSSSSDHMKSKDCCTTLLPLTE